MSARVTGSSFARLRHCQHPIDAGFPREDISKKKAIVFGNAVHNCVENGVLTGDVEIDTHVVRAERFLASLRADVPKKAECRYEPAYGILHDGPALGVAYLGQGRDTYAVEGTPAYSVAATADVVLWSDETTYVVDWKTGREGDHYVDQLELLCGLVEAHHRTKEVRGVIFYTETEKAVWVDDTTGVRFARALSDARKAALSVDAAPKPGDWCDIYCPGRGRCSAYVEASGIVPASSIVKGGRNPLVHGIHTVGDLELALDMLEYVDGRMKALKTDAESFAAKIGKNVDLPSGRVYKKVSREGGGWKPTALAALAERLGASNEDLQQCRFSSTAEYYQRFGKKEK